MQVDSDPRAQGTTRQRFSTSPTRKPTIYSGHCARSINSKPPARSISRLVLGTMRFGFSMAVAAAAMAARKRPAQAKHVQRRPARKAGALQSVEAYQLLEEIAEGAHGVAWKARDLRTGAMVAVKWIRREETTKPRTDCLAACRGHPGIVHFKNIVADADTAGDSNNLLRSRLTTRPFTEDETRDAMRQLLRRWRRCTRSAQDLWFRMLCDIGHVANVPEKFTGTLQYRSPDHLNCCHSSRRATDHGDHEEDALDATMELYDDIRTLEEEAFDDMGDLSLAGRQLLAGLLAFLPDEELTAADALQSPLFTLLPSKL
ncbi:hypothetical protein HU200_060448 [Digitaria exilis]|uniref:Protein kinase domain-containing protein n=1 Tax=Digitaria exilis TaxID=1010633 RepID=A0A835A6H2_9POAL|nr:hypothetical protein HU200_060448 [Digitaria exilis]